MRGSACAVIVLCSAAGCRAEPPLSPEAFSARMALGAEAERRGDLDAAARHYQEALRGAPRDPRPAFALGNLAYRRGDFPGAASRFTEAAAADPGFFPAWNNLALARARARDFPGAWAAFRRASALPGPRHVSEDTRGHLLRMEGRAAEARGAFERALSLAPPDDAAFREGVRRSLSALPPPRVPGPEPLDPRP